MSQAASHLSALAAIVGAAHVHGDRPTLSAYAWNHGVGANPGPTMLPDEHWPVAVVMPRTTHEVAAIVRYCNRTDLAYRALGTGIGAFYVCAKPNVVLIDLTRMDSFTIDADNQMAVLEPGVVAGRLQAAAMRHGLTTHIVGAGPSHSPLASATSFMGIGISGTSTGNNARNLMSIEWVSPTGEIVRIGSTGDDWSSEEPPGPGFRGLIRGLLGTCGGLGVFTRIGYKLHPWGGPSELTMTGRHPQVGMQLSGNLRFFLPIWPTLEKMTEATYRLNRSGVVFAMLRMPPSHTGWVLYESNEAYAPLQASGKLPEWCTDAARFSWQILLAGHGAEQTAVQERIVRNIVAETGGRIAQIDPAHAEVLARNLATSVYVGRVARGAAGGATSAGVLEAFSTLPAVIRSGERVIGKDRLPGGQLVADTPDGFYLWTTEGRSLWGENLIGSRNHSAEGMAVSMKAFLRHFAMTLDRPGLGGTALAVGPLLVLLGHKLGGVDRWQRQIKNAFDPKLRAEASYYVDPKEPPFKAFGALAYRMMFSRFSPLLGIIARSIGRSARDPEPPAVRHQSPG